MSGRNGNPAGLKDGMEAGFNLPPRRTPVHAMDAPEGFGQYPSVRRRLLLSLAGFVSAVYLARFAWDLISGQVDVAGVIYALVAPSIVVGGVVLVLKRPGHPIGELLLLCGIASPMLASIVEAPTIRTFQESGAQGWMWASIWLSQTSTMVALVLAAHLVVLLPDGRPRNARERRFLRAAWVVVAFPTLAMVSNERIVTPVSSFHGVTGIASPLFIEALEPIGPLLATLNTLGFATFLGAIALLFLRYHATSTRERKQIRWVLFGGFVVILVGVVPSILAGLGVIPPPQNSPVETVLSTLSLVLLPASVVVAVMEPRWIDVDIVIRRSVVYGALSLVILVVYVAVAASVGAAGARLGLTFDVAVVLTVIIAILFQPARNRLQSLADRWVFGARPTKYEAVTDFGVTIEQATEPAELLPRLAETIKQTIRFAWVTISLEDGSRAETGAVAGEPILRVPLGAGGEHIGEIACGPKTEGRLSDEEVLLVRTLGGQLALAVRNARLASRIVDAAESERRRIERNIHDGAQQELVALVARLGMAKSAAAQGRLSPDEINDMRIEAQRILAELRELAQGIHPSVLSDGGILEAVEDRCARLPLEVTLEASEGLRARRFGDNIEGAAYFFVTESLANVLKHAGATRTTISLTFNAGRLQLGVSDDGRGFDPASMPAGGLVGLRDRIRALGGTLTVASAPGRGTRVSASLPVGGS
jgi:signal transduction histidine kinase